MGCGHVAPSCARRCAGSRLPDHARCSFFVRSRHHARVRPRRAIRLFAGSMWRAHQHSHNHVCTRTNMATQHGRTRSRSGKRATSTTHLSRNMRCTSTSRTKAIAAGCSRLTATLLPALLPACCHCTLKLEYPATPAIPRPTILHPAVPGPCMRFVQDALQSMPAWAARPLCSHSLWKMHRECTGVFGVQLLSSGRKSVASRLLPVASAFGCFQLLCTVQILSHHTASCTQHTPHANHTHHLHLAPYTPCTSHTLHLPHSYHA